jgi:hypothetical protein
MPTIQDANTKIANFPNKFVSPFGNEAITPFYSSVPLRSPVEGCLECVVCGSVVQREQIILNDSIASLPTSITLTSEPPIIDYLIVGGGGASSGGYNSAGGGGGGGQVVSGMITIDDEKTYSIVVGLGGVGAGYIQTGTSGDASSFNSILALGGIHGNTVEVGYDYGATSGNGNAGGTPFSGSFIVNAGGGGGAGSIGGNAVNGSAGNGGAGVYSSITGTNLAYGGGGGGGAWGYHPNQLAGLGGVGGGGAGSNFWNPAIRPANSVGQNGVPYTGGGGGGTGVPGGLDPYAGSSSGGSGVVILSIPLYKYTGLVTGSVVVTDLGTRKLLTFTGNGTYSASPQAPPPPPFSNTITFELVGDCTTSSNYPIPPVPFQLPLGVVVNSYSNLVSVLNDYSQGGGIYSGGGWSLFPPSYEGSCPQFVYSKATINEYTAYTIGYDTYGPVGSGGGEEGSCAGCS